MIKAGTIMLLMLFITACTPEHVSEAQVRPIEENVGNEVVGMTNELNGIEWFGHSTFRISAVDKSILFIDPYDLGNYGDVKADLVFITHAHFDHFSADDLQKIGDENTVYVVVKDVAEKIDAPKDKVIGVAPDEHYTVKGIEIDTVPAYNYVPDRLKYHPRENEWVGYILTIDGKKIYHAGDTDFIEEMRDLPNLDVAFLPIGGTFTMDVVEAVLAANAIKAKVTVPIHYRNILKEKSAETEKRFVEGVTDSQVIIMEDVA